MIFCWSTLKTKVSDSYFLLSDVQLFSINRKFTGVNCFLMYFLFFFCNCFCSNHSCKYNLPILFLLYPIIRKSNFPSFLFSDTWRVTSPEKEKEIPPLRVVSQSCVSLSLKKEVTELEWKKAEDRFSHYTGRNDVKHNQGDHMHTIALTYV